MLSAKQAGARLETGKCSGFGHESTQAEHVDVEARAAVEGELRHQLADDAAELEAVTRKPDRQGVEIRERLPSKSVSQTTVSAVIEP